MSRDFAYDSTTLADILIYRCTGARQVCTLFPELKRTNKRIGVTSMCMGTGKLELDHPVIALLIAN